MPNQSIITYEGLPISSGGGHTLKSRDPRRALEQVLHFLATCTEGMDAIQCSVELMCGCAFPAAFTDPIQADLTRHYGAFTERKVGMDDRLRRWRVPADDLTALAAMIADLTPLPPHAYGWQPISLEINQTFFLIDEANHQPLPNQGVVACAYFSPGNGFMLGTSRLYARLTEKSTASVTLSFPFPEPDARFFQYREFIQRHIPFKMSNKHWKRWNLTKKGNSYVGKKIDLAKM